MICLDAEYDQLYSKDGRYSDIISIGLVSDTGWHYYSVVKPKKIKLPGQIKELTGLTKDDVSNGKSIKEVLDEIWPVVFEESRICVWGNDQLVFRTCADLYDEPRLRKLAKKMEDASRIVRKRMQCTQDLGLEKAKFVFFNDSSLAHNALSDAKDLLRVMCVMEDDWDDAVQARIALIKRFYAYNRAVADIKHAESILLNEFCDEELRDFAPWTPHKKLDFDEWVKNGLVFPNVLQSL